MHKKTLLQHLLERNEQVSTGDMLPTDAFDKIAKLIQDAAMEPKYTWLNVLDLVHQAYKVCKVDRPMPAQTQAWNQYEQHIEIAVKALQKSTDKGVRDNSWKFTNPAQK